MRVEVNMDDCANQHPSGFFKFFCIYKSTLRSFYVLFILIKKKEFNLSNGVHSTKYNELSSEDEAVIPQ